MHISGLSDFFGHHEEPDADITIALRQLAEDGMHIYIGRENEDPVRLR